MTAGDSQPEDEPGISLDDLPDSSSEPAIQTELRQRRARSSAEVLQTKTAQDSRRQYLGGLSDEKKVNALTARHVFDRRLFVWWKALLCFIPVAFRHLEVIPRMQTILVAGGEFNIMGQLLSGVFDPLLLVMPFAEFVTLGLLILWPPLKQSPNFFSIGFDGIDAPQRFGALDAQGVQRVRLKWNSIKSAQLVEVRDCLRLFNGDNAVLAELRWDLSRRDKKTLLKLLRQMNNEEHPLRALVEREVG